MNKLIGAREARLVEYVSPSIENMIDITYLVVFFCEQQIKKNVPLILASTRHVSTFRERDRNKRFFLFSAELKKTPKIDSTCKLLCISFVGLRWPLLFRPKTTAADFIRPSGEHDCWTQTRKLTIITNVRILSAHFNFHGHSFASHFFFFSFHRIISSRFSCCLTRFAFLFRPQNWFVCKLNGNKSELCIFIGATTKPNQRKLSIWAQWTEFIRTIFSVIPIRSGRNEKWPSET